ncbi:MAG: hypothetical protein ABIQ52_12975 [Vicinamibacterales bacterium]
MGRFTSTLFAASAAAILAVGLASAQTADRKTVVTVSGPVSIPRATLPAGTYVFKLADSPANRHVVQIFDRDEAQLITTLLAVKETPSDRPPAMRYWYYAGEKAGNEFVYPKAQAMMIARASGESVSAVDSDSADINGWKSGSVNRVTADTEPQSTSAATTAPSRQAATTTAPAPQGEQPRPTATPAPMTPALTTSTEPTSAPAVPAQTAPAAAAAPSQPEQPVGTSGRPARLPRTASELPVVGLLGLLAIAIALGVRFARRSLA